jgi:hypothetical protein
LTRGGVPAFDRLINKSHGHLRLLANHRSRRTGRIQTTRARTRARGSSDNDCG